MASEPTGSQALTLRVAQLALLVRLVVLFVLALLWLIQGRGAEALGITAIAALSYVALRYAAVRSFVARHPLAALFDVALLVAGIGLVGIESPFVLALSTSALLVGLWLATVPGLFVLMTLLTFYIALLTRHRLTVDQITNSVLVQPAFFITLWCLGLVIQRSSRSEATSQAALRDAMAAAATAQERGRIAREMHDTVAKSLQAMALTASSIRANILRRPEVASVRAGELEEDSRAAIAQVRELMQELRTPVPVLPFSALLHQVIDEWRSRTGRRCTTKLAAIEVTDGLVRYELLMCLREALENVHRHAGPCTTTIQLTGDDDEVRLLVRDDGVGSTLGAVEDARTRGHFGVVGMRERMEHVGGRLRHETAPGEGTIVECVVHRRGLVEKG
ncbi:MAG: hypothetical protein IPM00_16330 [Tetrasphaera sp.]|nr:hypothetical protein [Tetrasphaera sp.]